MAGTPPPAQPRPGSRPLAFTVKVDQDVLDSVDRLAGQLGITRAEAGFRALRAGLEMFPDVEGPIGRGLMLLGSLIGDPEISGEIARIREHLAARRLNQQLQLPGMSGRKVARS